MKVGETSNKSYVYLFRKVEKLEFAPQRGRYQGEGFDAPEWACAYPTVDEGNGLRYRILPPADWRKADVRVLMLQLHNTSKPPEVGRGESELLQWFHVGAGAPARAWALVYGDFILFRNHLRAVQMLKSELAPQRVAEAEAEAEAEEVEAPGGVRSRLPLKP